MGLEIWHGDTRRGFVSFSGRCNPVCGTLYENVAEPSTVTKAVAGPCGQAHQSLRSYDPVVPELDVSDRGGVQVVRRTALILRALRDESNGLTLSQIATRVGLARSTVYRLIAALEQERFVVAASKGRGYRLGPGLASLTVAATRDLTALIHPYLAALSSELNETVDLVVLEQESVLFIDRVIAPSRDLFVQSHVGAVMPTHSTAPGKALLATLPDSEVERLLPARLEEVDGSDDHVTRPPHRRTPAGTCVGPGRGVRGA